MKSYSRKDLDLLNELSSENFLCYSNRLAYFSDRFRCELRYEQQEEMPCHLLLEAIQKTLQMQNDRVCLYDKYQRSIWFRMKQKPILIDGEKATLIYMVNLHNEIELFEAYSANGQKNRDRTNRIPCGFFCFHIQKEHLTCTYSNAYLYTTLGYRQDEMEKSALLSTTIMHEDDLLLFTEKIIRGAANHENSIEVEFRVYDKEHRIRWMLARVVPDEDEGNYLAAVIDITERKKILRRLKISEQEKHIALRQGNLCILRYHLQDKILYITDEGKKSFEQRKVIPNMPEVAVKHHLITEETLNDFLQFYHDMQKGIPHGTAIFKQKDFHLKEFRWIKAKYSLLYDEEDHPITAIISYEDYTEVHDKELAYERWRQEFDKKKRESIAYYEYDLTNDKFENLEGEMNEMLPKEERRSFTNIAHYAAQNLVVERDRKKYLKVFSREGLLTKYQKGVHHISLQYQRYDHNGNAFWCLGEISMVPDPYAGVVKASVLLYNIDEKKKNTIRLKKLSETDALTGLLNRASLIQRVNKTLYHSGSQVKHALILIDLDHFKNLNDTYGHQYGDKVLMEVAATLKRSCRGEDLCARLGGDEFVIFLRNLSLQADIKAKMSRLLDQLKLKDEELEISASMGAACYPFDGDSFSILYDKADQAMYAAKRSGRNQSQVYENPSQISITAIDALSKK